MEILAYVIIGLLVAIIALMFLIMSQRDERSRQTINAIYEANHKTNEIIEDQIGGVKIAMKELG